MVVGFIILAVLIGLYIYHWLRRFISFLRGGRKLEQWWSKALLVVGAIALTVLSVNIFNTLGIILLHFFAFAEVIDFLVWIGKKLWKSRPPMPKALRTVYRLSVIPLALVIAIMVYGFWNMGRVVETDYTVTVEKDVGAQGWRVAFLSDIHYGSIQDPAALEGALKRVDEADPDLVILGGDIVEENTSQEELRAVFAQLGRIKNRYGIYYVYGNHDNQSYIRSRSYTDEELREAILQNGIQIVEDACIPVGDDLLLVGRSNAAWGNVNPRPTVDDVLAGQDRSKVILVADHQPVDILENVASGVDIQISGHTHAGQVWPVGAVERLLAIPVYGRYQEENTTVIISSGVAGWAFPIRTEAHSEFVILDIVGRS